MIERFRAAWLAFTAPPSETWYVVEDLHPLGWHVLNEEDSEDEALRWVARFIPRGTDRIRVMRTDEWETATLAAMRSDAPWFRLGEMAAAGNRWREHEYETSLRLRTQGAERNPERTTGSLPVLPIQHGTGWPADAPTTPVPGLSVENDPERVGTRLERALRRGRHVAEEPVSDGGPWDTGPHDDHAADG